VLVALGGGGDGGLATSRKLPLLVVWLVSPG